MARFSTDSSRKLSYGHRIAKIGPDHYRLSWVVDRYYPDSRLRHPRSHHRDTDTNGARRFSKKWDTHIPD